MSNHTSYTYDDGDRIESVNSVQYTYDNRGNLTSDGTWTYTYDGAGRMVRAEKEGSVCTYTYNGDGLLVSETIDGAEAVFTWDLALDVPQVLATSDGTKNLYGLERIGVEQGGAWRYPLADALGSVRQWRDPAGGVLAAQSYGPFGEPRDPLSHPQVAAGTPRWGRSRLAAGGVGRAPKGFTGEWQDPAGIVYLRARWYNPALGRVTQVDPVAGDLTVPGTQHPYTYGLNSPLRYADPSGRSFPIPRVPWSNRKIADMSGWPEWAKTAAQVVGSQIGLRVDRAENTIAWPSDEEMFWRGFQAFMLGPFYEWSFAPTALTDASECARDLDQQDLDSLLDWDSYPENPQVPRPEGPFRLLEGEEYEAARAAANAANKAIHAAHPELEGLYIHGIHPVKFGGSPTDPANKAFLTFTEHRAFTSWWRRMQAIVETQTRK